MQKDINLWQVFPACFITDSLITFLCRVPQPQRQSTRMKKIKREQSCEENRQMCGGYSYAENCVWIAVWNATRSLMLFQKHDIAITRRVTQTLLQAFLRELQNCSPTPKLALYVVWMLYHLYVHKFMYGSLCNQNAILTDWQGNYPQNTIFSLQ